MSMISKKKMIKVAPKSISTRKFSKVSDRSGKKTNIVGPVGYYEAAPVSMGEENDLNIGQMVLKQTGV